MPETAATGIEKRRSIRFPFTNPLEWNTKAAARKMLAQSENMSLHGMKIISPVSCPDQSPIVVHILGSSPDIATLSPLRGSVVWVREENISPVLKYSIGVEFDQPEREALSVLAGHAIAQLTNKIEKNPDDLWLYRFRGDAKKARGDLGGALQDYDKAEELKKNGRWRL